MGKSMIRKNPGKVAGKVLTRIAALALGYVGSAYASNTVIKDKIKLEMHGPGATVLGGAASTMLEDGFAQSVAEGVTVFGLHRSVGDLVLKENKNKVGLSGIGASWEQLAKMDGVDGMGETYSYADIQKMLNGVDGVDGNDLDGVGEYLAGNDLDGVGEYLAGEGVDGLEEGISL